MYSINGTADYSEEEKNGTCDPFLFLFFLKVETHL